MNEWLDDFEMFGAKLNEGEKILMRIAASREQKRIIDLLDKALTGSILNKLVKKHLIALINGENK